jgi:hypothetical protein
MSPALSAALGRLIVTAALLLVALGGAGLAVAADLPHTDEYRPELTARADRLFEPWQARMAEQLNVANDALSELSRAGREILGDLYSQDVTTLEASLGRGAQLSSDAAAAREALLEVRLRQARELPDRRLGGPNRSLLAGVDQAIETLAAVPGAWHRLDASAGTVAGLLRAMKDHDDLVFEATTAGRDARWQDALVLLARADASLGEAADIRDRLAQTTDVSTLDELLRRYAAYDDALAGLYGALDGGASPDGDEVAALEAAVAAAQSALPADSSAVSVVVADAFGPAVAETLVVIEEARGVVAETLGSMP